MPLSRKGTTPARAEAPVLAAAAAAAGGNAKAVPVATAQAAGASTYVVRAGDTLYGIARRFGTAVDTLLSLNKLSPRAVIQPGLRLRLQ